MAAPGLGRAVALLAWLGCAAASAQSDDAGASAPAEDAVEGAPVRPLVAGPALAPQSTEAAPEVAAPVGSREVVRIDGVAAVVGGAAPGPTTIVIWRSDVALRARLALLRSRSLAVALGPVPSAVLSASLSELLGEGLIALEARRLNLEAPSEEEREAERERLLAAAGPDVRTLLRTLGVGERELTHWIERRAIVSAFLAANLEGTLDVSDMELERLFRAEPHPYQGEPFAAARDRFARWLERQRTEAAVRRWVDTLAQRTPHRVFARYP